MTILWILASAAFLVALAAWMLARRTARKLAELTNMYWQLKYDHGELKAKVAPTPAEAPEPKQTFVPLSAIKRS